MIRKKSVKFHAAPQWVVKDTIIGRIVPVRITHFFMKCVTTFSAIIVTFSIFCLTFRDTTTAILHINLNWIESVLSCFQCPTESTHYQPLAKSLDLLPRFHLALVNPLHLLNDTGELLLENERGEIRKFNVQLVPSIFQFYHAKFYLET